MSCFECLFHDERDSCHCGLRSMKWLVAEYKEPEIDWSKVPIDTLIHKSKHMSIESFRADKNEISIFAKCQDYDVAEITQHWFDYINSEITNQMSNWNKIVPSKDIGYLPSIESLKVELAPYEYIDGKNKPKFSVDTSKALDLLRGAGIYEKPEQSFREILQKVQIYFFSHSRQKFP